MIAVELPSERCWCRFADHTAERGDLAIGLGVATWEPNEKNVLETIRELGLELQIVFNKGAFVVLPADAAADR